MAGGMNRGVDRRTLHERIHGTPPTREAERAAGQRPDGPRVKHCWVTDGHGRQPGLLLEWRQTAAGWEGRVMRPVRESYGWVLVEDWLPAALLTAARE